MFWCMLMISELMALAASLFHNSVQFLAVSLLSNIWVVSITFTALQLIQLIKDGFFLSQINTSTICFVVPTCLKQNRCVHLWLPPRLSLFLQVPPFLIRFNTGVLLAPCSSSLWLAQISLLQSTKFVGSCISQLRFIVLLWKAFSHISNSRSLLGFLIHPSQSTQLSIYSNADWAGCPDDRKYTSDYCIYFGDNLITWSSKKQLTVAHSSTKPEYRALAHATAESL